MPDLRHNFIKGRMNLDLDDRLVPDGEYRHAMNVEVSTSEGSNVGTIQSVLGNHIASSNIAPTGGWVSGSITNNKENKIYYLVSCNEISKTTKDLIVEYTTSSGAVPVVVDVHSIKWTNDANFTASTSSAYDDTILLPITDPEFKNIRAGMVLTGSFSSTSTTGSTLLQPGQQIVLTETSGTLTTQPPPGAPAGSPPTVVNFGPIIVHSAEPHPTFGGFIAVKLISELGLDTVPSTGIGLNMLLGGIGDVITFKSKKALNFKKGENITGINIVDDFLFWTDNYSEPKKINIKHSKAGSMLPNGNFSFDQHTNFITYLSSPNNTVQSSIQPLQEENITVIKQSPLTAPSLEMYNTVSGRGDIVGITDPINFTDTILTNPGGVAAGSTPEYDYPVFPNGTTIEIPFSSVIPDFVIGDILILTTDSVTISELTPFTDAEIRVVIIDIVTNSTGGGIVTVKILSSKKGISPHSIDSSGQPDQNWAICLEQSKSLFEFKFPKFAYRYKYQDGEYSSFSPFSEIAFLPGYFKYDTKESYNLGMVNQIRFLKILDFEPDGLLRVLIK